MAWISWVLLAQVSPEVVINLPTAGVIVISRLFWGAGESISILTDMAVDRPLKIYF
jgi:hypothetical protein